MQALIPIIEEGGKKAVSAKELYLFLEIKSDFSLWCKRMFEYGFEYSQDYIDVYLKNGENPKGGRPSIDYALSIDCAKEISMLQRTDKGKEARQYFIECEKKLQQAQQPPQSMEEMLLMSVQLLVENKKAIARINEEVDEVKNDIMELKAKSNVSDAEFYAITGYASLIGKQVDTPTAAAMGKKATSMSKAMGIMIGKVYDPRFGQVNTYHKDVLKEIFK